MKCSGNIFVAFILLNIFHNINGRFVRCPHSRDKGKKVLKKYNLLILYKVKLQKIFPSHLCFLFISYLIGHLFILRLRIQNGIWVKFVA